MKMMFRKGIFAGLRVLVGVVLCILGLASCEKEPVHDSLEQHWRLEQFTILESQEVVSCERLFFGITRMVTEVAEKQVSDGLQDGSALKGYGAYVARTEYREGGAVLVLRDFKVRGATSDAKKDATVEQLLPFGINNQKETVFQVLELSHRSLVLESDYARLEFQKF